MKPVVSLVGLKFGRLTVIRQGAHSASNRVTWDCVCECGNPANVVSSDLKAGKIQSCGCLRLERIAESNRLKKTTHGIRAKYPRFYGIWRNMVRRCTDPRCDMYCYYGGRGVVVQDGWEAIEKFAADMLDGYTSALNSGMDRPSIERKDTNGNYCITNCCWIPLEDQCKNKGPYKKRSKQ